MAAAKATQEQERPMTTADAILAFIESRYADTGLAPSAREAVAAGLVSSTSQFRYHCQALERAGRLHCAGHGTARSWLPVWAPGMRGRELELRQAKD